MSDKNHEILPLSVVVGYDITKPKPADPTPPSPPEPGVFGLSGGRIRFTPSPYAAGVDWDRIEHAPAPSCLGRLEMPIAHLSIQVKWLHEKVAKAAARTARSNFTRYRKAARKRGVAVPATPEQIKLAKEKKAAQMRHYRKMLRLERERIRGHRMTPEELAELKKHRQRAEKIKRTKAKKRRREIRRAYIDALMRDAQRARAEIKGK